MNHQPLPALPYRACAEVFGLVVRGYVETKRLPLLCATSPDKTKRQIKLGASAIDFTADVELATEAALKNRPELQAAWFQLAQEHPADRTNVKEVIHRCGAEYIHRRLEPIEYFTTVKRRRGEPIPR